MKRTRPLAQIALAIFMAGLASLGLMFPLDANDPVQPGAVFPLVKYADGSRIQQVYFHPPQDQVSLPAKGFASVNLIQGLCEKQVPLGESCFKLRLKLVTRLRTKMALLMGRQLAVSRETTNMSEKLAVFDFDLFYDDLPVANACRTVLVHEGRPVAIRDRNLPAGLTKPAFPMEIIAQNTAWSLVAQNTRSTFARLYPGKTPRLTVSRDTPTDPDTRLVLWPDQRAKKLQPAWTMTVRSTQRSQPFLRRYWVAASPPARILDFEDLIFYQLPAPQPGPFNAGRGPLILDRGALSVAPRLTPPASPSPAAADPRSEARTENGITAVFPGAVTGTVTGTMWETSPYRNTVSRPLPSIEIAVLRPVSSPALASTDEWGRYSLIGLTGLAMIRTSLSGPACRIVDEQAGPKNDDFATYTHNVGGSNVDVDYFSGTTDEAKLAQTSAYYYVNQAFDFVKNFLPERPTKLPRLPTHVNLDSACNAYYDRGDGTLNFFRGSVNGGVKGCPNTAYRERRLSRIRPCRGRRAGRHSRRRLQRRLRRRLDPAAHPRPVRGPGFLRSGQASARFEQGVFLEEIQGRRNPRSRPVLFRLLLGTGPATAIDLQS